MESIQPTNKCVHCSATEKLKQCGSCKSALYCSVEHQKADWSTHKITCLRTFQTFDTLLAGILTQLDKSARSNQLYTLDNQTVRIFNFPQPVQIAGFLTINGKGIAFEPDSESLQKRICEKVTFQQIHGGTFNDRTLFSMLSEST